METESLYPISVHHGHIIRRLRLNKGLNQQDLGTNVGLSQQSISDYEKKRVIEDEILARFAKYFQIPLDELKDMEEDHPMFLIENNNIESTGTGSMSQIGLQEGGNINNNIFVEKITELYERLLNEEKEKNRILEAELHELRKQLARK